MASEIRRRRTLPADGLKSLQRDFHSTTIPQLIAVQAVAQAGSYAGAARLLGVGDRSVTKNLVKRFERTLEFELFEASGVVVHPREDPLASQALLAVQEVCRSLLDLREVGSNFDAAAPLRVSAYPAHVGRFLGHVAATWGRRPIQDPNRPDPHRERLPRLDLGGVDDELRWSGAGGDRLIESGQADVAIHPARRSDLEIDAPFEQVPLYNWRLMLLPPVGESLGPTTALRALVMHPLLASAPGHATRELLDRACDREGVSLSFVDESHSFEALYALWRTGNGALIVASDALDDGDFEIASSVVVSEGPATQRLPIATSAVRPTVPEPADVRAEQRFLGGAYWLSWRGGVPNRWNRKDLDEANTALRKLVDALVTSSEGLRHRERASTFSDLGFTFPRRALAATSNFRMGPTSHRDR